MPSDEGEIKDLREKLEAGKLTRREALEILEKKRLRHGTTRGSAIGEWFGFVIWVVLCFAYVPFKIINSSHLDFFDRLPTIIFPISAIYLFTILFVVSIVLQVYVSWYRKRKGGLTEGDPVIMVKDGPYAIVRHPSNVLGAITFIALPIVLSSIMPFTILSCMGTVVLIVGLYWSTMVEEKRETLRKWGDEYREYMQEVPRWNFIKGLWNLRKKHK